MLAIFLALITASPLTHPASRVAAAPNATFTVTKTADTNDGTCNADCSLREAIGAANAAGGADTIAFAVNGTFTLSLTGSGEDANASGDLDITDSVTITGNGIANTIINGSGDRVMETREAAGVTVNLSISNLTIQGGNLPAGVTNSGTGIADRGSTTGISVITLNGVLVTSNSTGQSGGGIFVLRNGSAASDPSLTINNSTIAGNTSTISGGGINCNGCDLTVTRSTISGNAAVSDGGGIAVAGNTATVSLTNVTIAGNTANGNGGGIAKTLGTGTIALNFTTVAGNTADNDANATGTGGGLTSNSGATLQNSIVQGNTNASSPGTADCAGAGTTSNNFNVVGATTGCPATGGSDSTASANLGPLANNGGPTLTRLPGGGSAAIERVTVGMSGCIGGGATTDQRGAARAFGPNKGQNHCDSGAVEGDATQNPTAVGLHTFHANAATPVAGLLGLVFVVGLGWFTHKRCFRG